jgi:hypothetical protein
LIYSAANETGDEKYFAAMIVFAALSRLYVWRMK